MKEFRDNPCGCRDAVSRVYQELREKGVDDDRAFRAATRVYHHWHPEVEASAIPFKIAPWVSDRHGN